MKRSDGSTRRHDYLDLGRNEETAPILLGSFLVPQIGCSRRAPLFNKSVSHTHEVRNRSVVMVKNAAAVVNHCTILVWHVLFCLTFSCPPSHSLQVVKMPTSISRSILIENEINDMSIEC